MDERVLKRHGTDANHWLATSPSLDLGHTEPFEAGWTCINVASPDEIRQEVSGGDAHGNLLIVLDTECVGEPQILQVLLLSTGLRPNLAHVAPLGRLGAYQRQRLHHLLGA